MNSKKGMRLFFIVFGVSWLVIGFIFFSTAIPGVGVGCGISCWKAYLWIIIPSAISLVLAVLFSVREEEA